jgi:hypothetical protein
MITRHLSRGSLAAAALAAITLLAGCGGAGPGPFQNHDSPNGICGPLLSKNRVVTQGGEWSFTSTGPTAVIDKVSLSRSHGFRILGAWVIKGAYLYGNWLGYPSPRQFWARQVRAEWSHRQRAVGARIPPTRNGNRIVLVVVIKLVARTGSANGFDVWYHTSSAHYHLHMIDTLLLWDPGIKPPKCT